MIERQPLRKSEHLYAFRVRSNDWDTAMEKSFREKLSGISQCSRNLAQFGFIVARNVAQFASLQEMFRLRRSCSTTRRENKWAVQKNSEVCAS